MPDVVTVSEIVTVVQEGENVITAETVIDVIEVGIQGVQGVAGIPGPPSFTYVHFQNVPAAFWSVVHNMGGYPNVTVIDSTGREVLGEVVYLDGNHLTITFSSGFAGTAYLS